MPVLLAVLLLGTLAYLWWMRRRTSLTRMCRWRQDRARGDWACAACGQRMVTPENKPPTICLREN